MYEFGSKNAIIVIVYCVSMAESNNVLHKNHINFSLLSKMAKQSHFLCIILVCVSWQCNNIHIYWWANFNRSISALDNGVSKNARIAQII